jgi:AcrR family transcriptional regulator
MRARADAVDATRERIARAALDRFIAEPYEAVTIAGVAKDAGVSHQTVLNHFASKEGLFTAATGLFGAEVEKVRGDAKASDAPSAVALIVRDYEANGDGNVRLAMQDQRIPAVEEAMDFARASHQTWLEEVFVDRLPSGRAARRRALLALHSATDVYAWKLLRRDFGLSRRETQNVMTDMVEAILDTKERKP